MHARGEVLGRLHRARVLGPKHSLLNRKRFTVHLLGFNTLALAAERESQNAGREQRVWVL
jgi:hypothetical protein